jgi:hypothetical protein
MHSSSSGAEPGLAAPAEARPIRLLAGARATGEQTLPAAETSWYRRFLAAPAPGFLIEHEIHLLPAEQQLDLLVACREALAEGGVLRLSAPDPRHPMPAYRARLAALAPLPDLEAWCATIAALGFVVQPQEGYRRDGSFLLAPRPDFRRRGGVRRSAHVDPRHADPALRMSSIIVDALRTEPAPIHPAWPERIYALGDSHVRFLAGRDETSALRNDRFGNWYERFSARIVGLHLGPALAHNANRPGTRTHAHERMIALIDGADGRLPRGARLLFCFGEIDCRFHVVRQSEARGVPIAQVVDEICDSYIGLLETAARAGFRPAAWGPVAPTWAEGVRDPEHPVIGSFAQRLGATRRFHARMGALCAARGFGYLALLDELLDAGGVTDPRWFVDTIHLSQRARPLLHQLLAAAMPLDPPFLG